MNPPTIHDWLRLSRLNQRNRAASDAKERELRDAVEMERMAGPGDQFFTARQLGALRHPNIGEGAAR